MRHFLILLCALAVSACASASNPGAMIAELSDATIIDDASALRQNVSVGEVSGGKETNPLWTSEVSNEDFAEALRQSFSAHAMLATETGRYRLDATLEKLKQPFAGFNMTVTSTVNYTLTDLESGDVLFTETIEEAYTAEMGDAFMGVKRLQLANEGSIKQNISSLIKLMIETVDQPMESADSVEETPAAAEEEEEEASS